MDENYQENGQNNTPANEETVEPQQNYYYENQQAQAQNYYQPEMAEAKEEGSKGLAVASLVCGICSIVLCCFSWIDAIVAIVGLVLGIVAKVKKTGGRGMSTAGIICSSIGLILSILWLILLLLGIATTTMNMVM